LDIPWHRTRTNCSTMWTKSTKYDKLAKLIFYPMTIIYRIDLTITNGSFWFKIYWKF
jgi:hypothetical protein